MQVVEEVSVQHTLDPWLSLPALSKLSGLSVRTLRAYLADPDRPLPCFRMKEPHVITTRKGRARTVSGKILVRWSEFEAWMNAFRHKPTQDIDRLVDEVVQEFRS